MTRVRKTAGWRVELRQIIELVEKEMLSYSDLFWHVQNAWLMFASEHRLPEIVEFKIEEGFKSRPNFWSTAAELAWIFDFDNKTVRKFIKSREMQKLLKVIREQESRYAY